MTGTVALYSRPVSPEEKSSAIYGSDGDKSGALQTLCDGTQEKLPLTTDVPLVVKGGGEGILNPWLPPCE